MVVKEIHTALMHADNRHTLFSNLAKYEVKLVTSRIALKWKCMFVCILWCYEEFFWLRVVVQILRWATRSWNWSTIGVHINNWPQQIIGAEWIGCGALTRNSVSRIWLEIIVWHEEYPNHVARGKYSYFFVQNHLILTQLI